MYTSRNAYVVEALTRMDEALRRQDREAFLSALGDLVDTPGDEEYPSYEHLAFSRAVAMLHSHADAEDVVAGSVLRLVRAATRTFEQGDDGAPGKLGIDRLLSAPSPAAAVGKYLATTVTNMSTDLIRARRSVPVSDETLRSAAAEAAARSLGGTPSHHDEEEQLVLSLALQDALGRLDPGLELTLRLVYLEQWTHAEVAGVFGVSRPTVSAWVRTGLSQMQDHLGE